MDFSKLKIKKMIQILFSRNPFDEKKYLKR